MISRTFLRATIINFITAFIVAIVACYFLIEFKLTDVMYIGSLFGLYFLVVFGIDIMIESGELPNNKKRFIFAVACIVVFDLLFLLLIPLLFGANVFDPFDYLVMVFDGVRFDLILNVYFYLIVFSILMLIFNYILYKWDIHKH
ncbi:hypothetical protein [Methanobrevibacter sp.]|uniref:hypothetical protein n=1 Tax=Methanobrevibacter sp. TaxID=66852 RepID=UPI0026DFE231|nr:hypothetical protein [Methanobrevibacter sp.]MDO5859162.1 hypothetical protein [Methanobrevibacter sp.]